MSAKASRNDPCPCGSGRKFKVCCLRTSGPPSRFTAPPNSNRLPVAYRSAPRKWNEVIFDAPLAHGGRLHANLLYSDAGLRLSPFRMGEILTLDLPDVRFRGPATVMRVQPSQRIAEVEAEVLRVVRFRHDDDLGTALHGEWNPPPEFVARWRSRRREIVLRLDYPNGGWCEIRLLRTLKWVEREGVRVGGTIFLDLSEVGTRGWAEVVDILPCGPVEVGPGEMVTGTFKHTHGTIGELFLDSEPKPIGVTPGHLFWSEDRQAWVPVASLRRGETLQTSAGTTRVVSYTLTGEVEPVYNLEVEHVHCYRVGESGVLVHNMSGPANDPNCNPECEFDFPIGQLAAPNPNTLTSTKVSGDPSGGVGVYVKKHFGKLKSGSAGGTTNFRNRYRLGNPEGGCNIWYELPQTRNAAPDGLSESDGAYWTPARQRRFDEEYVDRLIGTALRYRSEKGDAPVQMVKWRMYRHIFGYGQLPENFGS